MSARDTALERLGVTEAAVKRAPQITPQLRAISATLQRAGQPRVTRRIISATRTGPAVAEDTTHHVPYGPGSDILQSWPQYLHMSDAKEAAQVLDAYYSLPKSQSRMLPVEAFCVASGVSPLRVLELVTAAIVRLGAQASTIIAAVNHPRVVEKTVEMALTDEGTEDRATLHKATGFLPTPKSAQTNISVVTSAQASAAAQSLAVAPPPEQTIRKLVDRFNDARRIPPPSALPVEGDAPFLLSESSVAPLERAVPEPIDGAFVSRATEDESDDMDDDELSSLPLDEDSESEDEP